jgi:hypothetical protein
MATYAVALRFTGTIHDHDYGFWDRDEEENFNLSTVRHLNAGSPEITHEMERVVDNEVKVIIKLRMSLSSLNVLTVTGEIELWEGPWWTKEKVKVIQMVHVAAGETITVFDDRLDDNQGDWATVTGSVSVSAQPQNPAGGPVFNVGSEKPGAGTGNTFQPHVTVIAQTPSGRNVRFWDHRKNIELTRREFVGKIQNTNEYDEYHIAVIDGVETPKANPNLVEVDNLG